MSRLAPGVHLNGAIRTQRWRTAAWELRKLRAETEIAERQLAEMPMRRLLDIVKVSVTIVGVILAMIVMFRTIGLLS